MSSNKFIFNNIPFKKISYGRQKGFLEVKLYDAHYNVLYKNKVHLNKKDEVKIMFKELKLKGLDVGEISWF